MKRNLSAIITASAVTLIVYVVLYFIWGAVANEIVDEKLKISVIAIVSSLIFVYNLIHILKIKDLDGEDEILFDYKDQKYTSFIRDIRLAAKREVGVLLSIVGVILVCFLLHSVDRILFAKRVISLPTFVFAPMCLFTELVKIPFFGYVISAAVDCTAYIILLLIYRRNTYKRTQKNKRNPY